MNACWCKISLASSSHKCLCACNLKSMHVSCLTWSVKISKESSGDWESSYRTYCPHYTFKMLYRMICVDCCGPIEIPTNQKQASGPGQWQEVYKGSLPNTSCRHLEERCHQQKASLPSCMQFSLIFPCSLMSPSTIWLYFFQSVVAEQTIKWMCWCVDEWTTD